MAPKYNRQNNDKEDSLITNNGILAEEYKEFLLKICSIVVKHSGIDFTYYKFNTLARCVEKRMKNCSISNIQEYINFIEKEQNEITLLSKSFLIGVTKFFRDKEPFKIMKNEVIPDIFKNSSKDKSIRIWVAGCSTGEEAYSIAILLHEYMNKNNLKYAVKIFATDIDVSAIEFASKGNYPETIAKDVPKKYINKYFTKKEGSYQINSNIRDMIIFSIHNIFNDPPYSNLDLVSCRNLLIYFQTVLQKKVLSFFQFTIKSDGYLFMGSSEPTSGLLDFFSPYNSKFKIFKRTWAIKQTPILTSYVVPSISENILAKKNNSSNTMQKSYFKSDMENFYINIIENFMPPSIVINDAVEIVQICGNANMLLKIPKGKASLNLLKMLPEPLSIALGTAISKVKKVKKCVGYTDIKIFKESCISVSFTVKPFSIKNKESFLIVLFKIFNEEIALANDEYVKSFELGSNARERIIDLELELEENKKLLKDTVSELKKSEAELQSTNEELQSANEELHSLNEELITVNHQQTSMIEELTQLNTDINNFLNSTNIGTVFLDEDLCIRKFTSTITKEINLISTDIGRSIDHVSHCLCGVDLKKEAQNTIKDKASVTKEVTSKTLKTYILRMIPYITLEQLVQGVIITLVDITEFKKATKDCMNITYAAEKTSSIIIITDNNGNIEYVNSKVLMITGYTREKILGKSICNLKKKESIFLGFEKIKNSIREGKEWSGEISANKEGEPVYWEYVTVTPLHDTNGNITSFIIIKEDITKRKESEALKIKLNNKKKLLEETLELERLRTEFFSNLSHEFRTPLNVILGAIQLLEQYYKHTNEIDSQEKIIKKIEYIKQNSYRLLRMINNLIDITKIDAGFFKIHKLNLNIVSLVKSIVMSVEPYIEQKMLKLKFLTNIKEKVILCDPDIIERIILNLLSNSVKFTDPGGKIFIKICNAECGIKIIVRDTGIGIASEKHSTIFQKFMQDDKLYTRNREGSGIGLSLVKSLVELHGGKISHNKKIKYGTEFIIELIDKEFENTEINKEVVEDLNRKVLNVERLNIEFSDIYNL